MSCRPPRAKGSWTLAVLPLFEVHLGTNLSVLLPAKHPRNDMHLIEENYLFFWYKCTNLDSFNLCCLFVSLFFLSFTEEVNRLRERDRERQELSQGSGTERRMENWKREVGRELSSLRGHITTAMSLGNLEERCDGDEALEVVGVLGGGGMGGTAHSTNW